MRSVVIKPGDATRFELEVGSVRLRVVRPALDDVLEAVGAKTTPAT